MSEFDQLRQQIIQLYGSWLGIGGVIALAGGALSTMVGAKNPRAMPKKLFLTMFLAGPPYILLWLPIVGIYNLVTANNKKSKQRKRKATRQHQTHEEDIDNEEEDASDHMDPNIFMPPDDAPHP